MPRYKLLTPVETGHENALVLAETLGTLNVELVKKKLDPKLIESILERVSGAAHSYSDGSCRPLASLEGERIIDR